MLPSDGDFLEFAIWLSAVGGPKKVVANDQFVSARATPGARLELQKNGLIKIIEDHSGVGAAETIHEWTVGIIDERFMLVGFAYEFRDQLDEDRQGACTLNLLDGSGVSQGSNVRFDPIAKDINMVTQDFQPKPCKFKFNKL